MPWSFWYTIFTTAMACQVHIVNPAVGFRNLWLCKVWDTFHSFSLRNISWNNLVWLQKSSGWQQNVFWVGKNKSGGWKQTMLKLERTQWKWAEMCWTEETTAWTGLLSAQNVYGLILPTMKELWTNGSKVWLVKRQKRLVYFLCVQ